MPFLMPWLRSARTGGTGSSPVPEILWWKLNDGSSTNVAATVGGAGTTNADWITGKSGSLYALDFLGVSDNIQSNATINYGGVSKVTVCAWAWLDDITPAANQVLWESGPNVSSTPSTYLAYLGSNGRITGAHSDGGSGLNRIRSCPAPAEATWVHLAFVSSVNESPYVIRFFYDAVEQSTTLDVNDFTTATTHSTQTFNVGMRNASTVPFDGRLDDIRIYNRELLAAEIATIMNDPQ